MAEIENLKIRIEFSAAYKDMVILHLKGYIDQTNSFNIENLITEMLNAGKKKIIFNLGELVYISSAGWGIFIGDINAIRTAGGDLKIAGMTPDVYEVFQMLEFYHILTEYPTVEEAIESFSESFIPAQRKQKIRKQEKPVTPPEQTEPAEPIEHVDHFINELLGKTGIKPAIVDDKTEPVNKHFAVKESQKIEAVTPKPLPVTAKEQEHFAPRQTSKEVDISQLPLHEKITKVLSDYPLLGFFQLRKKLREEEYGSTRVGIFRFYRILNALNLNSRIKRYRYHRAI